MIRIEELSVEEVNRALDSIEAFMQIEGSVANPTSTEDSGLNWKDIKGKPSVYPHATHVHPLQSHTHIIADVTGLQSALDGASGGTTTAPPVTTADSQLIRDHLIRDLMGGY